MKHRMNRDAFAEVFSLLKTEDLLTLRLKHSKVDSPVKFRDARRGKNGAVLKHISKDWNISVRLDRLDGQFFKGALAGRYSGKKGVEISLSMKVSAQGEGVPRWMAPGIFYKENRPQNCIREWPYPRYQYEGGDAEKFESNHWAFRADRCPAPAVICWSGRYVLGVAVKEQSDLGISGIGFEGSPQRTCMFLNFPYREEPKRYNFNLESADPVVEFAAVKPNQKFKCEFYIFYDDHADDLHAYDRFIRKLYDEWASENPLRPCFTTRKASELLAYGLYTWHYDKKNFALYEAAAFDANCVAGLGHVHMQKIKCAELGMRHVNRVRMHVGWVSGIPSALALLMHGRENGVDEYIEAGIKVIDKIAGEGISPLGCFWPEWGYDTGWGVGWNPKPNWIHSRTISEAVLFLIRALAYEKTAGRPRPIWEKAARQNIEFILRMQDGDGNFGTYYDIDTGLVAEKQGTAGLLWIAALLEGAKHFNMPHWKDAALRAGEYYKRFVDDEYLFGAPEDVHLTPTSEDGYNGVISYVALFEATNDPRWLEVAKRAADWMLTFRFIYNVKFPENTFLERYDFRTKGGDLASVSNQHIHNYGLICAPELLRLWEHTGDDYYFHRVRDNVFCFLQTIAQRDGDLNARKGMISEQWYATDWAFHKGSMTQVSHSWCMGLAMYAHQYINSFGHLIAHRGSGKIYCLEPLRIFPIASKGKLEAGIHNPFDATADLKVRIKRRSGGILNKAVRVDSRKTKRVSF